MGGALGRWRDLSESAVPVNASVGSFVYCTLRLVDAAGMATVVSSDGARLVEPGCGENFGCVS